jgi:hypothetical protein
MTLRKYLLSRAIALASNPSGRPAICQNTKKRRKIDYGCAATITRVDRFLPIQGQSVGIFGHGDLSEKRFGWKPALSSASIAATPIAISPFQLRLQSDAPPD